jgi:preprotein translocase SecE subunit
MAAEEAENSGSIVTRTGNFFTESIEELKKVTHPTRQETMQATLVTLLIIFFVAICLFILDVILNRLMLALLS